MKQLLLLFVVRLQTEMKLLACFFSPGDGLPFGIDLCPGFIEFPFRFFVLPEV